MARIEYETRIDGSSEEIGLGLDLRLRAVNEDMADKIKNLLRRVGAQTATVLEEAVPIGADSDDPGHVHLADTIKTSGVVYRPGGAGGGGFYELTISVGQEGVTPQLGFLLEGTGIYAGRERWGAGEGNLTDVYIGNRTAAKPFTFAQAMRMTGGTKVGPQEIFRTSTMGQPPQTAWLEEGQAAARAGISQGVRDIGRRR